MLNPAAYARQNLDTAVGTRTPAIANLPTPPPTKPAAPPGSTPRRRSRRAPTPPDDQIAQREKVRNENLPSSEVLLMPSIFVLISYMIRAMIFQPDLERKIKILILFLILFFHTVLNLQNF